MGKVLTDDQLHIIYDKAKKADNHLYKLIKSNKDRWAIAGEMKRDLGIDNKDITAAEHVVRKLKQIHRGK